MKLRLSSDSDLNINECVFFVPDAMGECTSAGHQEQP
jgi:hypothetical protein